MTSPQKHPLSSSPSSSSPPLLPSRTLSPALNTTGLNNRRSLIKRGVRRSTTMPVQRFSGSVSPRLSRFLGDVNKFIDDNSTSATSFLSESFMNMSLSSRSLGDAVYGSGSRNSIRRRRCPTDLPFEEFKEFVHKTLPEYVQDQDLVSMLQDEVKNHPPTNNMSGSLAEVEYYLATILQSSPSMPALVVADLHTYRGLIHLMRGGKTTAAIEAFTRALWLQTHLMRSASNEQDSFSRLLDMALTEHRLGVAYGRNQQYAEAIDQLNHAIQSYERAKVGISEGCYVSAKEDLHEFVEAMQIDKLRSSGRAIRRSMLRRSKSAEGDCLRGFRRSQAEFTRNARRPRTKQSSPEPHVNTVPVEVAVVSY